MLDAKSVSLFRRPESVSNPGSVRRRRTVALLLFGILVGPRLASASGGVTFEEIAGAESGLVYERTPSASIGIFDAFTALPVMTVADWALTPSKPHGAPGAAILDYDGDGDLDIYVTNGPGTANSLFSNQKFETGETTFVDVAISAGVAAEDQDSSGVCFGDIDNDGDRDLFVLSNFGPNRLFENQGDGTFVDISVSSGLGVDTMSSVAASFGDVNNDGLLDVVVGNNGIDMSNSLAIVVPFDFNQHNQLFLNTGDNQFVDVSIASGIRDTRGFFPPLFDGSPTVTWAIALVDVDGDGDVDLVQADDQGGVPFARDGGVDRGLIHVFRNDGDGNFTDTTGTDVPASPGAWMGLSFADLNADGHMDLYGSNLGDYAQTPITSLDPTYGVFGVYFLGDLASRWYFGGPGGVFQDPGLGSLVTSPFGWGTSTFDYDNDGDSDILMHGGLYFGPVGQGSPGSILANDGSGEFSRDVAALADSTDHETRTVQGVAVGDLDGNGFDDIVSVANFDIPPQDQVVYNHNWGSDFDGGRYTQIFTPTGDLSGDSFFSGVELGQGTLSVELNRGGNGNSSVQVRTLGTAGITSEGVANRDGIGAVVTVRTASGNVASRPVTGGSSYASQDSLLMTYGVGSGGFATVEVLWPGGGRNRLYGVRPGEKVVFPEIPCSFDSESVSLFSYIFCLLEALGELRDAEVLDELQTLRFFVSGIRAFLES